MSAAGGHYLSGTHERPICQRHVYWHASLDPWDGAWSGVSCKRCLKALLVSALGGAA